MACLRSSVAAHRQKKPSPLRDAIFTTIRDASHLHPTEGANANNYIYISRLQTVHQWCWLEPAVPNLFLGEAEVKKVIAAGVVKDEILRTASQMAARARPASILTRLSARRPVGVSSSTTRRYCVASSMRSTCRWRSDFHSGPGAVDRHSSSAASRVFSRFSVPHVGSMRKNAITSSIRRRLGTASPHRPTIRRACRRCALPAPNAT